jgi:hypothetical protein
MPQHVLDTLAADAGEEDHRARPARARAGLLHHPGAAELGRLEAATVLVDAGDLELDPDARSGRRPTGT